jgi:hypothetical protein
MKKTGLAVFGVPLVICFSNLRQFFFALWLPGQRECNPYVFGIIFVSGIAAIPFATDSS